MAVQQSMEHGTMKDVTANPGAFTSQRTLRGGCAVRTIGIQRSRKNRTQGERCHCCIFQEGLLASTACGCAVAHIDPDGVLTPWYGVAGMMSIAPHVLRTVKSSDVSLVHDPVQV